MADNDTVRRLQIQGTSSGLDEIERKLRGLDAAQKAITVSAGEMAIASEASARKQLSTGNAMDRLIGRLDEGYRAQKRFTDSLNLVSRAADTGYFTKMENGAQRFQQVLEGLKREFEQIGGRGRGIEFGIKGPNAGEAQEAFRAFEEVAQAKAAQAGQEFARSLNERLVSGITKSARDSASVFEAAFKPLDDEARHRGQWAADQFTLGLNERLIAGVSKSAKESAAVFSAQFEDLQREIARRDPANSVAAKADAQARINQSTGIAERLGRVSGGSAEESAKAFADADAEAVRKLSIEYDRLGTAMRRRDEAIEQSNQLLARGAVDEQRHATLVTGIQQTYHETERALLGQNTALGKYQTGMGLARHEMINFSRQAQDVFVSLASGQAPLTVLIQQGTQIADIFSTTKGTVGGFFTQLITGAARFAMSLAGVTTGVAAFGAAGIAAGMQFESGQRDIERSMAGVGRQSGITLSAINRMADGYASAANTSKAAAREMVAAFAATGQVQGFDIPGTAGLTRNFAAQFDISKGDAAKKLAESFRDPTRAAQDLNKELGFLDAKTLDYIRTAQAQGRVGEAQRALADALGESLRGAADRTSGLAKAWNAVWNAASNAWDALGRATSGQATLEERLTKLIEARKQAEGRRSRSGNSQALSELDSGISDVQEQIRRQNAQRDAEARRARSAAASIPGLAVLDELNTYGAEIRKLEKMASDLAKALKDGSDALNPQQAREMAEAVERVQRAMQLTLTPIERQRQENAITVQAVQARTLAERTAVELARLQLDSAFKLKETEEQRLIILGKINEMQAQANREAQDAARSARDTLSLAGMRPYQRRQAQIEIEQRDLRERAGGAAGASGTYGAGGYTGAGPFLNSSTLPATTGVLRNMDAAFAANLKRAMDDIPGLSITSGWRSMERQAQLQREKPGWAASPTGSNHPKGLAADLSYNGSGQIPPELRARLERDYGMSFPLANRSVRPEPWHAEPTGARAGGVVGTSNNGLIASAGSDKQAANDLETYNSIVRTANDNLKAQQAQFEATRQTLYMTNEEVVKAQKYQELYNQAVQEGGTDLANKLAPSLAQVAAGYGNLARQQEELQKSQEAMKTVGDLGRQTISGFVSDLRNGASGAEMFRNALDRIASKLLDMALNDLFGKAFGNNAQGLFGGGGFLSGIGNFFGGGGGGGLGTTAGAGGLYADGGYTGPGGKWDPAGTVHRGEVVWSQRDVASAGGVAVVEAMRRGLPGYASGGTPGVRAPAPAMMPAANSNKPQINVYNSVGGEVSTEQREDGSVDVYINRASAQMGRQMVQGKGALGLAVRQVTTGQNLRG